MNSTVLKALQPKKYYENLLDDEGVRPNKRNKAQHRVLEHIESDEKALSVNLRKTVCLMTLAIVPNKNIMVSDPKIELSISGYESIHQDHLTQLINEVVKVEYKPDLPTKVKLVVVVHVISNDGNVETAIGASIPELIKKFNKIQDSKMTDEDPPVKVSLAHPSRIIKLGLVFKEGI